MSAPASKNAAVRWLPRYHTVTGEFQGKLVDATGENLVLRVLDVGREGLGVLVSTRIAPGTVLTLEMSAGGKDVRMPMTVVYCEPDLIHVGRLRCGLHRVKTGPQENLVSLFAACGLLGTSSGRS
jgi:hypothetical protein